jgi:hypothetical protein
MRVIDNALSVDVALVDTRSNRPLRTATIQGSMSDPIDARAAHGRRGYSHAGPRGASRRDAVIGQETTQPGADDYYLQARGYLLMYDRLENVDSAITVFGALESDPDTHSPTLASAKRIGESTS